VGRQIFTRRRQPGFLLAEQETARKDGIQSGFGPGLNRRASSHCARPLCLESLVATSWQIMYGAEQDSCQSSSHEKLCAHWHAVFRGWLTDKHSKGLMWELNVLIIGLVTRSYWLYWLA
jgi:hypothetical protein